MTSGGLLGPRPGGVTKSVQKGPGRQLTKNRSNDVSRSHSDGLFEASNFFDFLGGGLRVIICSLRVILYVNLHIKWSYGQNVTQKGAKCMYFYVQNESRLIFIRKNTLPPVAGL